MKNTTLRTGSRLLSLDSPRVMAIINLTPDSFYDGGKHNSLHEVLELATKMASEGADIFDLGAYSSRPDAADIPEEEEWARLATVIPSLIKEFPQVPVSVDTFRSGIARRAIEAGATIINDISSGTLDTEMQEVIAHYKVPYIMMHMRGTPKTMQSLTHYDHMLNEIIDFFREKIDFFHSRGAHDLVIDPGFGFAKTRDQNYELMAELNKLHILGLPVLAGVSRKSMIYRLLDISAAEALNGTTALHMAALQQGAAILRVHDVREAKQCIRIHAELTKYGFGNRL